MSSETTERNAVNTLVDKTFDSLDEDDEDEMIRIIVKRPCRSVCISEGDGEENRSGYGESDDISLSSSLVQDDDMCSSCSDFSLVQRPTKTRTKKIVVVPRSGRSFVPAPTNEGVKSEQTARCSCPLSHVYTPPFEWNRLACDLLVASAETVDARNRGYWEHIALVFQNEYQSHHPLPLQEVEMRYLDSRSRRSHEWNRTPCIGKACRSDAQIVHVLNDLTRCEIFHNHHLMLVFFLLRFATLRNFILCCIGDLIYIHILYKGILLCFITRNVSVVINFHVRE